MSAGSPTLLKENIQNVSTYIDVCDVDCSIRQMTSNTMYFLSIASDVIRNTGDVIRNTCEVITNEMDLFRNMMYISLYHINNS